MSRFQRIRQQAMSFRGGIAVAGVVAVALGLTQSAGTLAAPDLQREANVPIASANYYPTPLPGSIRCRNDVSWTTGAEISWDSAGPGMRYRILILRDNDPNQVRVDTYTDSLSYRYVGGGTAQSDRVRIYTVNAASGTTDATRIKSSGFVSHTAHVATHNSITRCSGEPRYDALNQQWENSQNWDPEVDSFTNGQPLVSALRGTAGEVDGATDEVSVGANLEASESQALQARSAETTTSATRAAAPTSQAKARSPETSASTPRTSSSSLSTSPTAATLTPSRSTVSTVSASASTVALPRGGTAEIVDGTTLRVTNDDGSACSAKVREGSTLTLRSGELEVTDAAETRVVEPTTCQIS